ncbi:MAG: Gfo/Idh/MocA family oxidoreductase [Fusicatenibacter sp.]|nr:Gfo/Idh/MocA family oxidoreductase [Lachnospiraceae bacterium]MDY2937357.1 Gfo/Idh/MocA family oxidoreductase [Fusicatenibacter sp.]
MEKVRLGIVGIGNMGSAHAMTVFEGKIEGMELAAVCDINPARLAWAEEKFQDQVKRYEDYQQMLESGDIDAVVIATPHKLHPVVAEAGFAAGLHVLTEKPAGIDTASVKRMNEAAKKSGKIFGIMYNQRTNPLFQELRKSVQSGKLGELKRMVWIINNWYRTQAYYDSGAWRGTWMGEGGGVLLNQCPHNLDIWQWIMGVPKRVRAVCRVGQYHDIHVEDDVTIYAEYEGGANAIFITSTGEYPGTNRMEISGTKGKAVLENGELKFYLLDTDEREICRTSPKGMPQEEVHTEVIRQENPGAGHAGILQNFADAIRKGTPLLAPGIEGINGLSISNAAYLSDWTGEWVELPFGEEAEKAFAEGLAKRQEGEEMRERRMAGETLSGKYVDRWSVQW